MYVPNCVPKIFNYSKQPLKETSVHRCIILNAKYNIRSAEQYVKPKALLQRKEACIFNEWRQKSFFLENHENRDFRAELCHLRIVTNILNTQNII